MKKYKKNLSLVWHTFENIMENRTFAPKKQMFHFPYYFQSHDGQGRQKALLWSKGLKYLGYKIEIQCISKLEKIGLKFVQIQRQQVVAC